MLQTNSKVVQKTCSKPEEKWIYATSVGPQEGLTVAKIEFRSTDVKNPPKDAFFCCLLAASLLIAWTTIASAADAIKVDKEKKSVSIPCKVAPRKLPDLSEVYPLEVICMLAKGAD